MMFVPAPTTGARHELMMEQDRYRVQFWAAFDAFVPGTPLL
jgi:lysophospholipase